MHDKEAAMARVPYLSREDLPPQNRGLYDQIASQRGPVAPPFAALLNSPEVAARIAAVGEQLRYVSPAVSAEVREIVTLATARELGCQYIWTHHVASARQAGVREEVVAVLGDGTPTHGLTPREATLVQFAREVLAERRGRDTTYGAVEGLLGPQGAVDLVLTIGYYAMLSYAVNALGVELEEGVAPLLPVAS